MQSYRHRPPRLAQLSDGVRPFYFITFVTHNRAALLANDEVHAAFICFCNRAAEHGVTVGRYILMPDHAHFFVVMAPEARPLKSWVGSLKMMIGKTLLRLGHNTPHWQEGFFDHVLRSSENYAEKWEYVRQNPVRAGLVETAESWRYQGEVQQIIF
jgi:Transposase and inactivated derivatives